MVLLYAEGDTKQMPYERSLRVKLGNINNFSLKQTIKIAIWGRKFSLLGIE
jgi:hypothetical protein